MLNWSKKERAAISNTDAVIFVPFNWSFANNNGSYYGCTRSNCQRCHQARISNSNAFSHVLIYWLECVSTDGWPTASLIHATRVAATRLQKRIIDEVNRRAANGHGIKHAVSYWMQFVCIRTPTLHSQHFDNDFISICMYFPLLGINIVKLRSRRRNTHIIYPGYQTKIII